MIKVLVVGVGAMGLDHAKAIASIDGFEIVGLVARDFSRWSHVPPIFPDVPLYNEFYHALAHSKPDAVCISSYTDTHAEYSIAAMEAGAHVFVEKPLATTVTDAKKVVEVAKKTNRKMVVGYILRHHPTWVKFIEIAKTLGKPVTVKMTSNQHSTGEAWETHKKILSAGLSPLIDCGIHYADLMCQITKSEVINIIATGNITSNEVSTQNEANMEIVYQEGSRFYFESNWGANVDPNFNNIRQAKGPNGTVIVGDDNSVHHNGKIYCFSKAEQNRTILNQQEYFLKTIQDDIDLNDHWKAAITSLELVFKAEDVMNFH
ncbi:MAG: Gfo/Idh/MocA family oxidoreductase [Kordiimonadaceae bacterium]|nr:Gfo/Idh/MocA family oxidoreductase [Kordiimonadaceae bacterium]